MKHRTKCKQKIWPLHTSDLKFKYRGAQSLSGRVLEFRLRGCGFEPRRRHCIESLSKTLFPLLSTGSTQEDLSWDGSVIECLTQDRRDGVRVSPAALRCVLEQDTLLVQSTQEDMIFHGSKQYEPWSDCPPSPWEQSNLGPYCLHYRLCKNMRRWESRWQKL